MLPKPASIRCNHYAAFGARKGRNPNALFDTAWYLLWSPQVAARGINPAVHFHCEGWQANLDPSPRFSTKGYLKAYPALTGGMVNPLSHFLERGGELPAQEPEVNPVQGTEILPVPVHADYGARAFEPARTFEVFCAFTSENRYLGLKRFNGLSPEYIAPKRVGGKPVLRLVVLLPDCNFVEIPRQSISRGPYCPYRC